MVMAGWRLSIDRGKPLSRIPMITKGFLYVDIPRICVAASVRKINLRVLISLGTRRLRRA